ncbi:MAG: hypothetical protein HKO66_13670 [Saprospiraceae bacterium]|nr:hypothetical protein [Saprospiraceae bacterium]NNL93283.1 hypothetical protein [Saprospiraceae bacterium]
MQIDIAESIRETLAERNPVGLYGLGTLSLDHVPADFGHLRKSLYPPKMDMIFTETMSNNSAIIDWLSLKYDITIEEAQKAFTSFCEKLLNAMVNYGKVNLQGVAYFYKDEDQILRCEPDQQFLSLFYRGLPEVEISLLSANKDVITPPPVVPVDKPDSQSQLIENDIETIEDNFGNIEEEIELIEDKAEEIEEVQEREEPIEHEAFDISLTNEKEESESLGSTATPVIVNEISETVDNTKVVQSELTEPTNEVTWNPDNSNAKWDEGDSIFNLKTLLLLLALLLLLCIGYYACNKLMNNKGVLPPSDDPTNLIDEDNPDLAAGLIDSSSLENGTVALPEKCIIITGAFKYSRNAIRMQDKLVRAGYDVYKETNGNLTRVGFKYDCKNENLEDYLQNIRRTISKKAWYLDPSLYVEYEQ